KNVSIKNTTTIKHNRCPLSSGALSFFLPLRVMKLLKRRVVRGGACCSSLASLPAAAGGGGGGGGRRRRGARLPRPGGALQDHDAPPGLGVVAVPVEVGVEHARDRRVPQARKEAEGPRPR
ncbi:unnamed protein product, partial [Heterosigma akashiwo]